MNDPLKMKCILIALAITLSIAPFSSVWSTEPPAVTDSKTGVLQPAAAPSRTTPSLEEARRQAEILHEAMHATLQVVHHRFYQEDAGLPLPAATLTDVFATLEKEQHITLRWLAVDGQAMNADHRARSPFEIEAVKALKSGNLAYEGVEQGVYRRAGAITLSNHCLKCHVPDRMTTEARTAGLMIAIPIQEK
jgi:hypothetical protein